MKLKRDYVQMASFFTKIILSFVRSRLGKVGTSCWQSNRPIVLAFTTCLV